MPAEAEAAIQTPLEYMLAVMNDPSAAASRRDQMALGAAPYVHAPARLPAPPPSPHDKFLPPAARGKL